MKRWSKAALLAAVLVSSVLLLPLLRPSRPGTGSAVVHLTTSKPDSHLAVDQPFSRRPGDRTRELQKLQAQVGPSHGGDNVDTSKRAVPNSTLSVEVTVEEQDYSKHQKAVVDMFKHAWRGYKQHAWGKDELRPLSKGCTSSFGLGLTIVDSLDTMWLMGLTEEFHEAREWVANNLDIAGNHHEVSVFETNIRILGGLLAAYHLSKDGVFLQKAVS